MHMMLMVTLVKEPLYLHRRVVFLYMNDRSQLILFTPFTDCPYTLGCWGLVWIFLSSFTQVCSHRVSRSFARNGNCQVHLLCHSLPYLGLSPFACKGKYYPFPALYIILGGLDLISSFPGKFIFAGSPLLCGQFGVSWPFLFWYNSHAFGLVIPFCYKITYLEGSNFCLSSCSLPCLWLA